jgi:UDP-glucose 4-epimerase
MKVLVTGGSGFLGSHVADALAEAGHDVVIFDRKPSPWRRINQRMVTGDLLDRPLLEHLV